MNGIQVNPTSQQEMRENVEKVLQFVASKKIRMHQTSAKGMWPWQSPQMILSVEGLFLSLFHIKQIMYWLVGECWFFSSCGLVTGLGLNDTAFLTAFSSSTVCKQKWLFSCY